MEFWNKLSAALKQKGFSTVQINKLQGQFGSLDATALLNTSPDELLPAMTGRTVAEKRETIETLLAVVREVQAQLEGGQPSPSRGSFTITGQIRTTDGEPMANVTVRAYERGVGLQTLLGEATTDTDGTYRIVIPLEKFITLKRKRPHLVVRAYTERNKLLGTSEIIFNATSGQAIDLNVENIEEAPLSTYETLVAKLSLLLGGQQLADLSDDDTKILGVEASVDLKQVEWLRKGARLARATRLPAETLYALASQRLPLELEKLLAQSDEKIQAALEAALKQNVIPAMPDGFIDSVLARFEELRVEQGMLLQHEITGQLQNQETDKPLAGFTVRIVELSTQSRDREAGMTSTDQAGEFSITYTDRPRSRARRSFRLHILDRQGKELHTTEVTARPGQAKLDDPISVKFPPIERPSPRVIELASTLRLNLSPELSAALERHKIATLDDIRRIGGLERLKDAAVGSDDPAVKRLQAHADLRALSDDIKVNDELIDKGYDSIYAVSRKTRRDFTKEMQASLGEEQAVRLNDVARKQALLLDNLATKYRVDQANGFSNTSTATDDGLETPCRCRECESAVSPLAYLTDLLDYAVRHVKKDDNSISLAFLEESFHQPFGELPVSCASGEEQMRQIRLAVEVLRSILDGTNVGPHMVQQLMNANRGYSMAAYQFLLPRIGASYDELRLTRRGSLEEKKALAERLAITQVGDVSPQQLIDQLWLDPEKQYPDLQALNEVNLERLFGLPATDVQSRFSNGARLGDEQDQISDWQFYGLAWLRNTDENGRVHLSLTKSVNTVLIKLYRNQARHETSLVASGSRTGNNGTVSLGEENLSGLSGTLTVQYKATANNISIVAFPFFLSWRLAYLRQQWLASKKPQYASPFGAPPVIDPDLVGPDDFRHPEPGNPAFDIWLVRRNWVDDLLKDLRSQTKTTADGQVVPDVQRMLDVMEDTGWQATTIADLEALDDLIQQATDLDAATSQLGRLFLSKASFRRMMDIKAKAERWEGDPGEPVTSDEWEEFYSILVQSLKQAMGFAWRTQEQGISGTLRSLEFFWPVPREPVEGQWPPLRPRGQPWIDPDTVKETDLPDLAAGDQARQYLEDRRAELMVVNEQLQATREAHGLEALLVQALGAAPARSSWDDELNRLQEDRLSSNAATADSARDRIASDLHMSETEFGLLITVKAKAGQTDSAQAPKPDEWPSIYKLLTRVEKERVRFPQWIAAESGLTYWNFRRARLPRWRATLEARQGWLEELQSTANLPVIDPDLVDIPDFITPFSQDKAFGLWQVRASELSTLKRELTNVTGTNHLEKINNLLTTYLGIKADRLEALVDAANEGNLTTSRLQQLTVSRAELNFMLRVRALALGDSTSSAVIDEEWNDLYDILIQVEKRRKLFPKWQLEERNLALVLSPDHFKLRQSQLLVTPSLPSGPVNTWRAKASDRREWDKTLKARIEQQNSITQALRSAVSATEEVTLPDLRNDLIGVLKEPDKDLAVAAKEMSQRLLIDMTNGGCQMTTRAGQAMVSIQLLLWSLRTGQIKAAWPSLSLDAEDFDEEWKWLGSYATWRAAMMVFLYPENILLPNLRKQQTPAFKQLIEGVHLTSRLTSEEACRAANAYADYFRDVCNLTLEASCWATSRKPQDSKGCDDTEKQEQDFLFLFARSKISNKTYWSIYDPEDNSGYAQAFWVPIPVEGFEDVSKIIGAIPYQFSDGSKSIYVYAIRQNAVSQEIVAACYTRGSKDTGWSNEALLVPIDEDIESFTAVALQPPFERTPDSPGGSMGDLFLLADVKVMTSEPFYELKPWLFRYRLGLSSKTFVLAHQESVSHPGPKEILAAVSYVNNGLNQYITRLRLFFQTKSGMSFFTDGFVQVATGIEYNLFEGALAWPEPGGTYAFVHGTSQPKYFFFPWNGSRQTINRPLFEEMGYLRFHLAPISGHFGRSEIVVGNERFHNNRALEHLHGLFISTLTQANEPGWDRLNYSPASIRIAPILRGGSKDSVVTEGTRIHPLPDRLSREQHRDLVTQAATLTAGDGSLSVMSYINEAFYLVPLMLAQHLERSGEFQAALDWFLNLYDYTAPDGERWLVDGLDVSDEPILFQRTYNWLLDPLDPHAVASTRTGTHKRHILLSIIGCLLAYADAEFTQDTAESNALARQLYTQALELLDTPELKQLVNQCDAMIGEIVVQFARFPQFDGEVERIALEPLDASALRNTATNIRSILNADETQENMAVKVRKVLDGARRDAFEHKDISDNLKHHQLNVSRAHRALLANSPIQMYPPSEDSQTYLLFNSPAMRWLPTTFTFCIPPNPILQALRFRAELNLYKLRTCRNIAGMERELVPYSAPTDVASGLPAIGAGGQINLPSAFSIRPTQYRYKVLLERAKQLVGIAQQMEATFLSFLEKGDAEQYHMLKARQDARLARAGVRLQDLRIQESENGVVLADLQWARAVIQQEHFTRLLNAGDLWQEQAAMWALTFSAAFQFGVAAVRGGIAIAGGIAADVTSSGGSFGVGSIGAGIGAAALDTQIYQAIAGGLSTTSSALSMWASFERRRQEWEFQKSLSVQDGHIGTQQITLSKDRVRITGQEREIANLQVNHADDVIEFLSTKFTNADLYDWMSGVMEGVYRYFLQQSIGIARLAENQLAFERQEMPPAFIQADYWDAPRDGSSIANDNGNVTDRRGLTGSARLLQDIYRLDQYAFETDKRKLQLTKTISLARLDPVVFQQFRETGVMVFATPMTLFDHDFPGHYLRLIKRVRTSVIALIPPIEGIKATLATAGISRVVIGGDWFQTTIVNRGPESVALTSPQNATGLFELESQGQGEMLLPFEGLGVDMTWEFRLPKPANAFDYRTIADVLVTIEYTALDSPTYRQQVIQQLDRSVSAERPFSFRHQFADAWYDLHHPELVQAPQKPMEVSFATRREDFPPNVTDITIEQVTLYVALKSGVTQQIDTLDLYFTEQGNPVAEGGPASVINGVAGTRQGNWPPMIGKSPVGSWTLAFKPEVKELFANDQIEDILFLVTFGGETPAWPQ